MERKKRIEKILSDNLKKWNIQVSDISYQHKDHNSFSGKEESHFSLILTSIFQDKSSKIEIHRKINNLLADEFKSGLHALEIKIKY